MSDIRFGTDGWRGRIGDDYTYANVRRAAQLLGIGRATLYRKIQQYKLRLQ